MWPSDFESRLQEWADLRSRSAQMPLESALHAINDWWFRVPMVNHHLHRQDIENWPNPWELLSDNMFCDLARALGIVYTIISMDHPDIIKTEIAYTENDNLVLVNEGLYILNWAPRTLLNINSADIKIQRIVDSQRFKSKYN